MKIVYHKTFDYIYLKTPVDVFQKSQQVYFSCIYSVKEKLPWNVLKLFPSSNEQTGYQQLFS